MIAKFTDLFNSIRFWQVTAATAFVILGHYAPGYEFLWNALAVWLGTVAGIGTLDSVATKMSSPTVSVGNPSDTSTVNVSAGTQ